MPNSPVIVVPQPSLRGEEALLATQASPASPNPKKAKLLRRLYDFFHQLGHHSDKPDSPLVVPEASTKKDTRHGRLEKFFGHFRSGSHGSLEFAASPALGVVSDDDAMVPQHVVSQHLIPQHPMSQHMVSQQHPTAHPRSHSRLLSLLSFKLHHESSPGHHSRRPSEPSSYSDDLDDSEFEIIKEKLPNVLCSAELSFRKKYRFMDGRVIGKGASGTVRLGCCLCDVTGQERPLAVKEFRRRRRDESMCQYLHKLTSEYGIASRLNHENVVNTMDIVFDGKRWYEVMEYCTNGDLFSFIQHGGLDDRAEIDWCFKQLVHGVHYLHSIGVAHRDLKPENLLIDQFGRLKITDFGVSQVFLNENVDDSTILCRGVCGSSPYIAPEEFLGTPYDARKVDVWAIGIIYYAMVFHGVPWEAANLKDPNYYHYWSCGSSKFEPFTRLPSGARSLLRKIMEPDPTKRISIDEIHLDPWFAQIEELPLSRIGSVDQSHN